MNPVKEQILHQCRTTGAQVTPLREQVLDMVLQLDGVIKAYNVLAQMQRDSESVVAPPTAYRALDFWAEQGAIAMPNMPTTTAALFWYARNVARSMSKA